MCHHYYQKQEQTRPAPAKRSTPGPMYEDVLPTQNTLELKENMIVILVIECSLFHSLDLDFVRNTKLNY